MKIPILILATVTTACAGSRPYGQDLEFLRQHTPIIELKSGQAAVAAPAFQGRVMTSTATGPEGSSFGWLNDKLIAQGILPEENAAGKLESHIYVFGGEERFWLGPEGGQFGIFFPREEIAARSGTALPEGAKTVAYETVNTITNLGEAAWTPESGLLSIWLLGRSPFARAMASVPSSTMPISVRSRQTGSKSPRGSCFSRGMAGSEERSATARICKC